MALDTMEYNPFQYAIQLLFSFLLHMKHKLTKLKVTFDLVKS